MKNISIFILILVSIANASMMIIAPDMKYVISDDTHIYMLSANAVICVIVLLLATFKSKDEGTEMVAGSLAACAITLVLAFTTHGETIHFVIKLMIAVISIVGICCFIFRKPLARI